MRRIERVSVPVLRPREGRSVTLLEQLGAGRCGTVYRGMLEGAWGLRRPVAVKVLETGDADPDEMMRHLTWIARRLASIRERSVVQLHDVDIAEGPGGGRQPYVVIELVEGESLGSVVDGWRTRGIRVPVDFAVVAALRAAEALGAALFTEAANGGLTGLVHGHISPRQILLSSDGEVKVGDFGESAFADAVSHVRSRSRLAYTAPEVACGAAPTARSDVFSLGIILHELLVGPRFAPGTGIADAMRLVAEGQLHATLLEPNLPRSLREVIQQATQRTPSARHPHARALAFDLRREMLRLGLCDTQTCLRHAVVGWCDVQRDAG